MDCCAEVLVPAFNNRLPSMMNSSFTISLSWKNSDACNSSLFKQAAEISAYDIHQGEQGSHSEAQENNTALKSLPRMRYKAV